MEEKAKLVDICGTCKNATFENCSASKSDVIYENNMVVGCLKHTTIKKSKIETKAINKQVSGTHYKNMKIQPVQFCMENNMNYCESFAIKYLCRHENKNGKDDLKKAIHMIELLIEQKYPEKVDTP